MGYLYNHLATVTCGVFAAVLTGLWPLFLDFTPALNFVFIMAVPITWFLVIICWLAQKSTDYVHSSTKTHVSHSKIIKQELSREQIRQTSKDLTQELNDIHDHVKIKDEEILRLRQQIANLNTIVQIETLKTELANLKAMAGNYYKK
ncbi:MAG: putative membrane protein [Cenarchaeum symbiont of Oopsacas minuta]|nr:putative membrane protein [Cenarchaeum symbiont of Oopsacas minuta]